MWASNLPSKHNYLWISLQHKLSIVRQINWLWPVISWKMNSFSGKIFKLVQDKQTGRETCWELSPELTCQVSKLIELSPQRVDIVRCVCVLSSLLLFVFTKCNQDRIDGHRAVHRGPKCTGQIENVAPFGPAPVSFCFPEKLRPILVQNKIQRFVGA